MGFHTLLSQLSQEKNLTLLKLIQRMNTPPQPTHAPPFLRQNEMRPIHMLLELPHHDRQAFLSFASKCQAPPQPHPTPCTALIRTAILDGNVTNREKALTQWCAALFSLDAESRYISLTQPDQNGYSPLYHALAGDIDANGKLCHDAYDIQRASIILSWVLAFEGNTACFLNVASSHPAPLSLLFSTGHMRSTPTAYFSQPNQWLLGPFQAVAQSEVSTTPSQQVLHQMIQTAVCHTNPQKKEAYHDLIRLFLSHRTPHSEWENEWGNPWLFERDAQGKSAMHYLFSGTQAGQGYDVIMCTQLLKLMIRCGLEPIKFAQHTNGFSLVECLLLRVALSGMDGPSESKAAILSAANDLYFWCVPGTNQPVPTYPRIPSHHHNQSTITDLEHLSIRDCEARNLYGMTFENPSMGCVIKSHDPQKVAYLKQWHQVVIQKGRKQLVACDADGVKKGASSLPAPNPTWWRGSEAPLGFRYDPTDEYALHYPLGMGVSPDRSPHALYPFSVQVRDTQLVIHRCQETTKGIQRWSYNLKKEAVWEAIFGHTDTPNVETHWYLF